MNGAGYGGEGDQPLKMLGANENGNGGGGGGDFHGSSMDVNTTTAAELKHFEEHRREYITILKELRQKHPDISIDELQKRAEVEILKRGPKSRAYYRIQATRKLVGGGTTNVKKRIADKEKLMASKSKSNLESILEVEANLGTQVYFEPAHYTCFESVGSLELYVARTGGDLARTVQVDFKTEDGTAEAHSDYEYMESSVVFYPHETRKHFVVNIIDDDVYEEDEHFYVKLVAARYLDDAPAPQPQPTANLLDAESAATALLASQQPGDTAATKLSIVQPNTATVMILDDDHGGVFIFAEAKMEVIENVGQLRVKVLRTSGARGKVKIPYKTVDGSAQAGRDYEKKNDVLVFYNNETEYVSSSYT